MTPIEILQGLKKPVPPIPWIGEVYDQSKYDAVYQAAAWNAALDEAIAALDKGMLEKAVG